MEAASLPNRPPLGSLADLPLDILLVLALRHIANTADLHAVVRTCQTLRIALLTPAVVHAVLLREHNNASVPELLTYIIPDNGRLSFCSRSLRVKVTKLILLDAAAGRRHLNARFVSGRQLAFWLRNSWCAELVGFALTNIPLLRQEGRDDFIRTRLAGFANYTAAVQHLIAADCYCLPTGLASAIVEGREDLASVICKHVDEIPSGFWKSDVLLGDLDRPYFTKRRPSGWINTQIRMIDILIENQVRLPEKSLETAIVDATYLKHILDNWNGCRPVGEGLLNRSFGFACRTGQLESVQLLISRGASVHALFQLKPSDRIDEAFTPLQQAFVGKHFDIHALLIENGAKPTESWEM
ncbi:hypothetical protein HDU87_004554 [Geranomyces variabilis]|uniref:Uncharacterized protein n=1 Tax=Geranomyces variabilis TaxID=109894 RepID=A0AAD5XPV2_9FUNG|nr:hypothetical protein HDU87_004554 [Geranomyces variabilis]